jgi:nicotinate-nucleotide adenylyltransferase
MRTRILTPTNSMATRTGVLGGTFDPIHLGHLAVADAALAALGLDDVLLVPARVPPHRTVDPAASADHRYAMVTLAAAGRARLTPCDLELRRTGPSYSADTLRMLHGAGYEALQIFFLTGADAFAEIATWHDYPAVLELANFVVCGRPGTSIARFAHRLPALAPRMQVIGPGAPVPDTPAQPRVFLLDFPTPDVSSTQIRARARSGQPLAGLVPPDVETYIRRHGLYGAPSDAGTVGRPAAGNLHG